MTTIVAPPAPIPAPPRTSPATPDPPPAPEELPGATGDYATIKDVLRAELYYLWYHRHRHRPPNQVATNLIGLALSGGGIRSATTNLGVLQALSKMEILPLVDYVSTVSGGGYIGACLSALLWGRESKAPKAPGHWRPDAPEEPYVMTGSPAGAQAPDKSGLWARVRGLGRAMRERLEMGKQAGAPALQSDAPTFGMKWERFPFRAERYKDTGAHDPVGSRSTALVAHLRMHGNFLVARKGLLRRETMRSVGHLLTGIVYHLVLFLLVLATAAALTLTFAITAAPDLPKVFRSPDTLFVRPDTALPAATVGAVTRTRSLTSECDPQAPGCREATQMTLRAPTLGERVGRNFRTIGAELSQAWHDWQAPVGRLPVLLQLLGGGLVVGLLCAIAIFVVVRARYHRYLEGAGPARARPTVGESAEDVFERRLLWIVAGTLLITIVVTYAAFYAWHGRLTGAPQLVWLFLPLAIVVGARFGSFLAAVLWLPRGRMWTRRMRSIWGAIQAIMIYGWWITLIVAVLPFLMYAIRDHQLGVSVTALGSLLAARLLTSRQAAGTATRFAIPMGLRRLLLGVAVALVVLLGVVVFGALLADRSATLRDALFLVLGGVAALYLFGRFVDHNRQGPHYFYRDRLAETYLLSELPDSGGRLHVFQDAMELPLHALHGGPATNGTSSKSAGEWRNPAPYHLISTAINLAGSRDLTRKDRKSGYWLFSKLYTGSTHTGFRPTARFAGGETKLARAIAISGAAASSAMGSATFFAQAFATVLFNVRLGYWVENPRHDESVGARHPYLGPRYLNYLLKEVLMDTTDEDRLVNLSDGGHTGDNVGIYPLFQRRCKVIIACDAERDGALAFNSFTEALRHAYVDLGVDVDIDLGMIRPDPKTGFSRSHCAVGRIRYPDRPHQVSFLVYLKNSLTGDEPEPLLNYKVASPDFPHETTADQFFDDAQFESYRALGVHLAETTFGRWIAMPEFDDVLRQHQPL